MFNQQQLRQIETAAVNDAEQNPEQEISAPQPSDTQSGGKSVMENADIYYMPENFQKNNKVAGRNINISGIVILILGILFLVILGAALYMYLVKPDFLSGLFGGSPAAVVETVTPTETTQVNTSLTETAPARPTGAPKDTYLVFRSELELADTVEKYVAVFARYGTKAKIDQLTAQKANLESIGGQGDILNALRGNPVPALDGTEDIREEITDTRAVLTVSKTNRRSTGSVTVLAEDGQWKISDEIWSESAGEENSNGQPVSAADDDSDGLTNSEEALLGTNAKASDSDQDGYNDLEELNNGYNPAGAGKIAANASLGTYLNTTFNVSLLYPVEWDRTIASTDDSVLFTASNRQFVQMLVQPNSNQDDIIDWYRSTFNVQTVPNSQMVINETWDGVKTPDGMTVYLTNKDKTYIFVVTYNLGSSKILEYKSIFDLAVRSLKLGA